MNFSSDPSVTRTTIAFSCCISLFIVAPKPLMTGLNAASDVSLRPMIISPGAYFRGSCFASTLIDNGEIMEMKTIAIVQKHRAIFVFFNFFLSPFLRAYAFEKGTV